MNHRPDTIGSEDVRPGERAYAVVLTALILVPLFGFAGFAVDVGAWYSRASELQRASDAAALAGVVWQPDFTQAEAVALEAAALNGFVDGVDNIDITVTDTGNNQLLVRIEDSDADLFFSSLFLDQVSIARQAVSEYVLQVPLGSPKNHFGTRELIPGDDQEGFSAAINGSCWRHQDGGHREVRYNPGSSNGNCGGTLNANYVGPYSYQYYVDIPSATAGGVDLFLRDPNAHQPNALEAWSANVTTTFRLRAPDTTPFDDTDNPVYTGCQSGSRAGAAGTYTYATGLDEAATTLSDPPFIGTADWDLFCRIPPGATGRFILEVGNLLDEGGSDGSNAYAILADVRSTARLTCDTRFDATCPSVVAKEWMSIFANTSSGKSEFFLAEIGNEHEGKILQITLFDPGEGSQAIRIIEPNGTDYATFDWSASGGSSANNVTSLNVSSSVFNNQFVVLTVQLAADFDTEYGTTEDWWKIEYTAGGGSVTDRTTWSVSVLGDPVRLLE